jgi:8-oxo-dGTP diphosphatase
MDKNKIQYVDGFLFSPDYKHVVLIRKNRPANQNGLLNGIGGRIELDEAPSEAMTREFYEEAGLKITSWKEFAVMNGENWEVYFYYAVSEHYDLVESKTDEKIEIHYLFDLANINVIPNLRWLIPMAIDPNHNYCVITSN